MIKLTFCLVRLPHLTRAEFQHYWCHTHGPLVRSVAHELQIRRYVQLHSVPEELNLPVRASRTRASRRPMVSRPADGRSHIAAE